MSFEYKAVVPKVIHGEDGGEDTTVNETVVLRFKSYGDAPGRISRHNIGFTEMQVWMYLEWGLVEPAHWPVDSQLPGHNIFDVMPQRQITKCYNAWQRASINDDDDEDDESGTST